MSCSRGAAAPDTHTEKRLFAASAGYCQNPSCYRPLFLNAGSTRIHIAEMAHICAANNSGPRANAELSQADRGGFDNLILLCSSCHTIVDKAPSDYPDTTVLRWKHDHQARLDQSFGAVTFLSRPEVRSAIAPLLSENSQIFEQYGPNLEYRDNPESEMAIVWRTRMLERIIPNNRRVLAVLDANRALLQSDEPRTLELFRQHVYDLEAKHLAGLSLGAQSQFPVSVAHIMTVENHNA